MRTLPVRIRPGAVLVAALVGVLVSITVLPAEVPDLSASTYLIGGLAAAVALLLVLAAGQLTAAAAARRNGLTVDRVDLGLLTEPAVRGEPATPGELARMSASGPLATAAAGVAVVGVSVVLEHTVGRSIPAAALGWTGRAALVLVALSLLPIGAMPGGRLLTAWSWWRRGDRLAGRAAAARVARVLGIALVAGGVVGTLLFGFIGLWLALAGWFVLSSASQERTAVVSQQALADLRVADVMGDPPDTVPEWLSVAAALDRAPVSGRHNVVAVLGFDGRVSGVVPLAAVAAVPPDQRGGVRVSRLALPAAAVQVVGPDEPATVVVGASSSPRSPRPLLSVVVDTTGQPVGLVTAQEVQRAVELAPLRRPAAADVGR